MKNYNEIYANRIISPNKNNTNIAVSILLDHSGSVSYNQSKIQLNMAYMISKSLEQNKSYCEIIEFGTMYQTIKSFYDKTDIKNFNRSCDGGNYLVYPLEFAYKQIKAFNSVKHKFIIIISDGNLTCDGNTFSEMESITTKIIKDNIPVYCFIVNHKYETYNFFCKSFHIKTFDDVLLNVKQLIYKIQKDVVLQSKR